MHMIFQNKKLAYEFTKNGFCVIPNFLASEQLHKIDEIYQELGLNKLTEIYSNIKDRDAAVNEQIDTSLVEIYKPSLQKHFINYRTGGGAFLIKGTGESSVSSLHQDWNVVDETKYQSMCVWCPLVDVDQENGCIQVVSGTHKWFSSIRSINIPSIFIDFEDVKDRLVSIPAKRGDAVIFSHNIFHGSFPNNSTQIRPAASVSVLTKGAEVIHYYKVENEIHILDAESFFNDTVHQLFKKVNVPLKVLRKEKLDEKKIITQESFKMMYKKKNNPINKLINFFIGN